MAEAPGFINVRRNLLHFPSMPAPLRILTGFGIAEVIVGILLLVFHDVNFPTVIVGLYNNQYLRMPIPFLLMGDLLLIGGWTYFLCGALQARWWLSFGALLLATLAFSGTLQTSSAEPLAASTMLLLWLYFALRKRPLRRLGFGVDIIVVGILLLVLTLAVLIEALVTHDTSGLLGFSLGLTSQVLLLLPLLIPMLVLAGVDLAEISAEGGAWLSEHVLRPVPLTIARWVVLALAALKIFVDVRGASNPLHLYVAAAPVAIAFLGAMAGLAYLLRRREREQAHPAFGLLLLLAYLLFIALIAGVIMVGLTPVGSAVSTAASSFDATGQLNWTVSGLIATLVAAVFLLRGRLRHRAVAAGFIFLLVYGVWMMLTAGNPSVLWRLAEAGKHTIGPLLTFPAVDAGVSLAIGGAVVALAFGRWRHLVSDDLILLGGVLVGLSLIQGIQALYLGYSIAGTDLITLAQVLLLFVLITFGLVRHLRRTTSHTGQRALALAGLVLVTPLTLGTLGLILATITQRVPANVSLPPDAIPAVMLMIGLSWDLLMSGGRFTNYHSEGFPRQGRVLFYVGYILLSASALLWVKSVPTMAQVFDETSLPPFGLLIIGLPLMLYLWALAARRFFPGTEPLPAPAAAE